MNEPSCSYKQDTKVAEQPKARTFGQIVIGPPGSGKTTYCSQMSKFIKMKTVDTNVFTVNMDPGNDFTPLNWDYNVYALISVAEVMDRLSLGPNGALVYSMNFIEQHLERAIEVLKKKLEIVDLKHPVWILFDMPGQVELYTHLGSVQKIVSKLEKILGIQICVLNLVDSQFCSDPGTYISSLLTCLTTMLHMARPQINVMSKFDLMEESRLEFGEEFYTNVLDLSYLIDRLDNDRVTRKYKKLNSAVVDIIERYGLVAFQPFDIQNIEFMEKLYKILRRTVGLEFSI